MAARIHKTAEPEIKTHWKSAALYTFASLALILALGSYNSSDPSLNTFSSPWIEPKNVLGYFGSWFADVFYQLFGYAAWLWPVLWGSTLLRWLTQDQKTNSVFGARDWAGLLLALCSATLFIHLIQFTNINSGFPQQGLLGIALSGAAIPFFGRVGSYFVATFLAWLFCMMWWEELPILMVRITRRIFQKAWALTHKMLGAISIRLKNSEAPSAFTIKIKSLFANSLEKFTKLKAASPNKDPDIVLPEDEFEDDFEEIDGFEEKEPSSRPTIRVSTNKEVPEKENKIRPKSRKSADEVTDWELPPTSLLQSAKTKIKAPSEEQLLATAERITNALRSFDIEGEVVEVSPGPIITMYEFQPAPGVRVNKLVSAQTDLAMTLGVQSVRVVAPIPGKCVAGIEVPNSQKQEIVLKDVFENTKDRSKNMKLPLVFGVDNEGAPVVEDLARMPHLLVGGATNMGKSVLVNSILTGLLCRFTPEDLKLIVVDPKLVEFKVFEDIPHLLLPIVNDPSDASQALKWAVGETKRRYLAMQKFAAKNLEAYNKKIADSEDEEAEKFPYILIIIDELAELMLTAKKDVEQSIVRLSQLARAAGIHLIMATQRPSADVVTGLIKSNCPSRAALRVASASDSRIILDCSGAEQLLGRGDMFFTSAGPMGLKRMQGAYVSDDEIERVCDFWREQGEPSYQESILAPDEDSSQMDFESEDTDTLFSDVLEFAREKGKVSTSLIQRRFQIGYTRAARIMDQLEQRGFVGEAAAAGKPRDVIL